MRAFALSAVLWLIASIASLTATLFFAFLMAAFANIAIGQWLFLMIWAAIAILIKAYFDQKARG